MAGPTNQRITAEMSVEEVAAEYPQTVKVFFRYGMQCIGCYISDFHNIAEGAKQCEIELEALLQDLNDVVIEEGPQGS